MKIALDMDGTISEYPEFFKIFSGAMAKAGCKIYIITDRPEGTEDNVRRPLADYGVKYDVIKITRDKCEYILEEGINVLFDDVDQYFKDLPQEVAVFKVRQKYNFDFEQHKWHQ